MSRATRATKALDAAGIVYRLHPYDDEAEAGAKGLQAAQALGLPPERVLRRAWDRTHDSGVCWLPASKCSRAASIAGRLLLTQWISTATGSNSVRPSSVSS